LNALTLIFWLHLCAIKGLGANRLAKCYVAAFDACGELDETAFMAWADSQPKQICRQLIHCFQSCYLNSYQDAHRIQLPQVEVWLAWANLAGNDLIALPDPSYPSMLKLMEDPPPLLFLRGQPEYLWQPQLAIVGSRKPSASGREQAFQFARTLSANGFTITSGLALGIDGAAHQGSLNQLGSTIAVLGSGIDIIYPASHRTLAGQIAETGLLVSEFPLGTPPKAANFPRRNRIISGLSLGTLVVEAGIRSGSLITARMALEQGREVFAMPGSIQNSQARGCHHLLKQGAKLVETTDDIFIELPHLMKAFQQRRISAAKQFKSRWSVATDEAGEPLTLKNASIPNNIDEKRGIAGGDQHQTLDEEAQQIMAAIGFETTPVDFIVQRTGLAVSEVQAQLMKLELMGLVRTEQGGVLRTS